MYLYGVTCMWHGPHRMAVIPIIRVVDLRSYCIVCGRRVEAWCGESRGFCVNARGGLRSALQRSVESRVECSERRDRVFGFACGICMIVPNQRARVPRARPRTSEQHGAVRSARSDLHAWPICRVCPRVTRHTRHDTPRAHKRYHAHKRHERRRPHGHITRRTYV